jgi:hypothetical protein
MPCYLPPSVESGALIAFVGRKPLLIAFTGIVKLLESVAVLLGLDDLPPETDVDDGQN